MPHHEILSRADLRRTGMSVREIAAAVHRGELLRLRRDNYCRPDLDLPTQQAVRVGGRLSCCSELDRRGVWVLMDDAAVHLRVAPNAARLRDANERRPRDAETAAVVHWEPLVDPIRATRARVSIIDALIDVIRCCPSRTAVAALDSALHLGRIRPRDLDRIAAATPVGRRWLLRHLDSRAESGLESFVRLLARQLGFRVQIQVPIDGVGFVDLVIEDWVVVETDGDRYHDAATSPRDRRRDALLAASGRTPLRFRYAQVVYEEPAVARAIIGAVEAHRNVRFSGHKARRALRRLERRP